MTAKTPQETQGTGDPGNPPAGVDPHGSREAGAESTPAAVPGKSSPATNYSQSSGSSGAPTNRVIDLFTGHLVGACLTGVAVFFTWWFVLTNPALPRLFGHLLGRWGFGGGNFEWGALAWAVAAVLVMVVLGNFFLECFELYIPRTASLGLAFLFGLGLTGFVLECLAIPYVLWRESMAAALATLLGLLAVGAVLRCFRQPQTGRGGDPGLGENITRRVLARAAYVGSLTRPAGAGGRVFCVGAVTLIAAIQFFIFWHALLYPEVYWDSLILYLGYARMTFLESGFPIKVTGQVGFGLGANYPHLYPVLGAGVATAMGEWSELPQRLIAPLAGLGTCVLIYHTALRLTRHVNFALVVTLLYRSIPLGIIYDQYASDYALALLFAAGFLYLALMYIQTLLVGYFAGATLLIGLAMHLNYLMGILWGPWLVMILAAHGRAGKRAGAEAGAEWLETPWIAHERREAIRGFVSSRRFWTWTLFAAALGSTWLIRNWIVTGNPVYAFFYEWLGGKHINPEVMQAAAVEWEANGMGIGRLGRTFGERLRAAWAFFVMWERSAYQIGPVLMGFSVLGAVAWLGRSLAGWLQSQPTRPARSPGEASLQVALAGARRRSEQAGLRFGWVVAALLVGLLAFHFILAPFYLYQIIMIVPCLALLVTFAWPWWRRRPWRWGLGGLALWIGLVPGLAMALMGFKQVGPFELPGGRIEAPTTLYPLRHPLPRPGRYYRWRYGEDPRMWDYVNHHLKGRRLLTHDNRHLVYDPSITLVHLDDWTRRWNIQYLWEIEDPTERVRQLIEVHDIHYYLRIPNEAACPTNARMGTAEWPALGLAELIFEAGENRLYRLRLGTEGATPEGS